MGCGDIKIFEFVFLLLLYVTDSGALLKWILQWRQGVSGGGDWLANDSFRFVVRCGGMEFRRG